MMIHPSIRKELEREKLNQLVAETRYQRYSRVSRFVGWLAGRLTRASGGERRVRSEAEVEAPASLDPL
jgi:hypothetical protein